MTNEDFTMTDNELNAVGPDLPQAATPTRHSLRGLPPPGVYIAFSFRRCSCWQP
jgi:hypothetical protein